MANALLINSFLAAIKPQYKVNDFQLKTFVCASQLSGCTIPDLQSLTCPFLKNRQFGIYTFEDGLGTWKPVAILTFKQTIQVNQRTITLEPPGLMKLIIHPLSLVDAGISMKPPSSLRSYIIPWAQVDYRMYHFGSILRQHFISKHFSVHDFVVDAAKPARVDLHCSQPYAVLQFTLEGASHGTMLGGANYLLMDGTTILFYLAKGPHTGIMQTGRFRSLLIQFNDVMLGELAEDMPMFDKMQDRVMKLAAEGEHLPPLPINYQMMGVLEKMLNSPLKTGALNLALRAGIFELVNLYNQSWENREYVAGLPNTRHKAKLVEIYDTIRHIPNIRTCRLPIFAKKYFLSPITLGRYFNQLFGINITDFVIQQVMEKAYWLLIETDKPIAGIAGEVGYSSVSNFSRAFIANYGQSPVEVRRSKSK